MLSLIVATSLNGTIGNNNKLPWHLPDDLKRFKEITMGCPVIMGRKTYASIGKPLPGRTNVVLSRNAGLIIEGVRIASSLEQALAWFNDSEHELFVIGGSDVFRQALPMANKIYLTLIHEEFEGDCTFCEFNKSEFEIIEKRHVDGPLPHEYITYKRI